MTTRSPLDDTWPLNTWIGTNDRKTLIECDVHVRVIKMIWKAHVYHKVSVCVRVCGLIGYCERGNTLPVRICQCDWTDPATFSEFCWAHRCDNIHNESVSDSC